MATGLGLGLCLAFIQAPFSGTPTPPETFHILDDKGSGGPANQVISDDAGSGGTPGNEITDP